MNIREQL